MDGDFTNEFIPLKVDDSQQREVGQDPWNIPSKYVLSKNNFLQPMKIVNFHWNLAIKFVFIGDS